MNRRTFILGLGTTLAAPSIVRAASLMPVSAVDPYPDITAAFESDVASPPLGHLLFLEERWHVFQAIDLAPLPKSGARRIVCVQSLEGLLAGAYR